MPEYVVLFPADDEAAWEAGSEADHQLVHDVDTTFARLLQAAGGAITGGAGLAHSSGARTLTRGSSEVLVSDGPATASTAQLSGFFHVTCGQYDALVDAARVLTRAHPVVEIRPVEPD